MPSQDTGGFTDNNLRKVEGKKHITSSVIYINGVHIHNGQNYYCAGAIISFNFSFDANVVSNIADIIINIEIIINIADRGKKRCRIRTPEGLWRIGASLRKFYKKMRPVFNLFWIVCYLYQWSSYSQPSKLLLLCRGDHQF